MKLYNNAVEMNHRNIIDLLDKQANARLLDLGCDDGEVTLKLTAKVGTKDIHGVEIVDERIKLAENSGIKVKKFDLNGKFAYPASYFDVVHSNQVVEHLYNSDNFISETFRILKPGGYVIMSTENASSWCNIFASIMGWQIFSLTNFSSKALAIGNPLAMHHDESLELSSWTHVRIYNIRGLKEYLELFGFEVEDIRCAGYFPLPGVLAKLDRTHGHFMAFKARKPR